MGFEQDAFASVEAMVSEWPVGDYMHHVQLVDDLGDAGMKLNIVFSKPTHTHPVPAFTANVGVMAIKTSDKPQLTFATECEQQNHTPATGKVGESQLDAIIQRKQMVGSAGAYFEKENTLPKPRPFVPGQYKTQQEVTFGDGRRSVNACLLPAAVESMGAAASLDLSDETRAALAALPPDVQQEVERAVPAKGRVDPNPQNGQVTIRNLVPNMRREGTVWCTQAT